MNEIVQYRPSVVTYALVGSMAALATNHVSWPIRMQPAFVTTHSGSTFSSFERSLTFATPSSGEAFGHEIAAIYASLLEGQEPLGPEFEAVWDANVSSLYES